MNSHHSVRPTAPYLSTTGCLVIPETFFMDDRGHFIEGYRRTRFNDMHKKFYGERRPLGLDFFQDNISISKKNVVRGLHFQNPQCQGKLVRVLNGEAIDVVLDLRKDSKTFGKVETFQLLPMTIMVFVPKGFAHGFWAKEDNTIFAYKCTNEYYPSGEGGINPLDEQLCLPWMDFKDDLLIAPKDRAFPLLKDFVPVERWN